MALWFHTRFLQFPHFLKPFSHPVNEIDSERCWKLWTGYPKLALEHLKVLIFCTQTHDMAKRLTKKQYKGWHNYQYFINQVESFLSSTFHLQSLSNLSRECLWENVSKNMLRFVLLGLLLILTSPSSSFVRRRSSVKPLRLRLLIRVLRNRSTKGPVSTITQWYCRHLTTRMLLRVWNWHHWSLDLGLLISLRYQNHACTLLLFSRVVGFFFTTHPSLCRLTLHFFYFVWWTFLT